MGRRCLLKKNMLLCCILLLLNPTAACLSLYVSLSLPYKWAGSGMMVTGRGSDGMPGQPVTCMDRAVAWHGAGQLKDFAIYPATQRSNSSMAASNVHHLPLTAYSLYPILSSPLYQRLSFSDRQT